VTNESVAPYVSNGIDAGLELRALGLDVARYFLEHLQKVASNSRAYRPYWKGGAFAAYRGRLVHRKDYRGWFIIYVVETESDGALRVTLIHAGIGTSLASPQAVMVLIRPRLKDFFA
jgi:hypothetical protein